MKTNELNKKLKTWLTLGALPLAVGGLSRVAQASVPNGDFSGKFQSAKGSSTADADVLIETVNGVNYGLVLRDRAQASLFQIEEVGDGTEAWVRIIQTQDGLLGSDVNEDAAYSGVANADGDKTSLTLTPSGSGPCNETISVSSDNGMSWLSLPEPGSASSMSFSGGKQSVTLASDNGSQMMLSGGFSIGTQAYSGVFALDQVIPGIGALHQESLDPTSQSGRSLSRQIAAMVALVQIHGFFGSSDYLELVQISGGTQSCADPVQSLKN